MRAAKVSLVLTLAAGLVAVSAVPSVVDARAGSQEDYYPLDTYRASSRDNAVLQWNDEMQTCLRQEKPAPTVAARALYLVHTATYDAWSAYDGTADPTITKNWKRQARNQRTTANKVTAISHAAYRVGLDLFPGCRSGLDDRLVALGQTSGDARPAARIGRGAAQNVIDRGRTDGSNQQNGYEDTTAYRAVNTPDTVTDPWRWQPLRSPLAALPDGRTQQPYTPHWGSVRPFTSQALEQAKQSDDPTEMDAAERRQAVDEILAYSRNLDDKDKAIAEYWEQAPPGHLNEFAAWASRRFTQTLDQDVKMFFGLNAAMHDAGVATWYLKYRYDLARPVTTIRAERRGRTFPAWSSQEQAVVTVKGEEWTPYLPTPPFPAYTSGHSTFSYAAAAFLKDFGAVIGRDGKVLGARATIPAGSLEHGTGPGRDIVLQWADWEQAAAESGLSRLYGGIHWDIDDDPSEVGKKVGEAAFSQAKKYWEG